MAWSRFEPGFSRHPKRIKSGPIASWLFVCSVDHCTEFKTNGFLDAAAVPTLCPGMKTAELKKATAALVAVRSWEPTQGGFTVHGYLEHNPSAEQVEADRTASRERYRRWKDKRSDNSVTNGVGGAVSNTAAATPTVSLSVSRSVGLSKENPPTPLSTSSDSAPPTQPARGRYGRQPDGTYRLHDGMFHDCPDGREGMCVKTEYINDVPAPRQCERHKA